MTRASCPSSAPEALARRNGRIVVAFQNGGTTDKIAAAFKINPNEVIEVLGYWRAKRLRRAARLQNLSEAAARIEVPAWAERAGLVSTYRTVAAARGEEAAAKHCRALKAAKLSGAVA